MNSYVYHFKIAGVNPDEPAGWYVYFTNDRNELVDTSGPWDDEHDAEMARQRAENY